MRRIETGSRPGRLFWPQDQRRPLAESPARDADCSIPAIHEITRSDQASQPLGDVEIRVIDGGDFVVVLLGGLVVAQGLGDPAQAVMEGEEVVLVLGLQQLEGLFVVALGQLGGIVGLEAHAQVIECLNL